MAGRLILRLLASAAVGAVVGGAVLLGLRLAGGGDGPAMREPVSVRASLAAPAVLFGDPLRATVEVLVDGDRVDPASVRMLAAFDPFRLRSRTLHREEAGGVTSLRWELELLCLERACLPAQGAPKPVRLPRGFVVYGDGRRAALDWPGVEIASRLSAADRVRPQLRLADAPPPPASFRVAPSRVAAALYAGAALLALGAVLLVGGEARRLLRRRRARDPLAGLPPLERALVLLDRARTPAARRAALDRLARAVGDGDVAEEARRLAWSEPEPDEGHTAAVAARAGTR